MQTLWAAHALTADGWQDAVRISVGPDGAIAGVEAGTACAPGDTRVEILLPAAGNLHSHAFQRGMAGLTERRGPDGKDSFWTWRTAMYRFLEHLTPEDVEAIAVFAQMEMLEAGYAAVGEFHYLHHQSDGASYDARAEMSERIVAAAEASGIGLTLLPVLYEHEGCDRRPLVGGQLRFGNDPDGFAALFDAAARAVATLPGDAQIGVAPHSLRALSPEALRFAADLAAGRPLHIHIAEQEAEVEEVEAAWGRRPVEWVFETQEVAANWCLIHATQMQAHETAMLAASEAVAGVCPITEASLGDGIFDGVNFVNAGGTLGIGTDSNIQITLAGELRLLEYSQRLRDRSRAALATAARSTGRNLYEAALQGGAQALGRASGAITTGKLADLVALDADATDLLGKRGDDILDAWIFAIDRPAVRDVWAGGRHVVTGGRHRGRGPITERYRDVMASLTGRL